MKTLNNKGYLLLEIIVAVMVGILVMGTASLILYSGVKDCDEGESKLEISYNLREALNYLGDEIRGSHGIQILDSSDNAWIKVYKTADKTQFVTFRAKNNKLFIGLNNMLNSNSELSNYLKVFKVSYLPEGANEESATGVKLYLKFENKKKEIETSTSIAFRGRK